MNFRFLKENVKKSRSIVIFLLSVVPLLNILFFFNLVSNDIYHIVTFKELETITFIFSFIFSIVLAYSLNSYLFKNKSADFYLSKPISRKKLYLSNLFTGIILIVLSLLINIFLILVIKISTGLLIPNKLIFDYFIYNFCLYLFNYALITLAIYISPNFVVAIIVFFILLFSYPSIMLVDKGYTELYTERYVEVDTCNIALSTCQKDSDRYKVNLNYEKKINSSLTLPASYVLKSEPTTKDFVKTILLSIIYIVIGSVVFKKRKIENNINITNEFIHYLIKTITIIPLTIIMAYVIQTRHLYVLILFLISVVYYLIYDIFTKKPFYKPLKSSIIFIWTYVFFTLIFYGIASTYHKDIKINLNEVLIENLYNEEEFIKIDNLNLLYNSLKCFEDFQIMEFVTKDSTYVIKIPVNNELFEYIEEKSKEEFESYLKSVNFKKNNYTFYLEDMIDTNIFDNNDSFKVDGANLLEVYKYHDYRYTHIDVPVHTSDKTFQNLNSYYQKKFREYVDNNEITGFTYEKNNTLIQCAYNKDKDSLIKYLSSYQGSSLKEDYIKIYYYTKSSGNMVYFINDSESFDKFLASYGNMCYNET